MALRNERRAVTVHWPHWPEGEAAFKAHEKDRQAAYSKAHADRVEQADRRNERREATRRGECPHCHAKPGEPCKTAKGRAIAVPHKGREVT